MKKLLNLSQVMQPFIVYTQTLLFTLKEDDAVWGDPKMVGAPPPPPATELR